MVFTTIYSFKNGNISKLIAPVDGQFRICGFDKGVEDYPLLYVAKMDKADIKMIFQSAVCVKKCPKKNSEEIICSPTKFVGDCNA